MKRKVAIPVVICFFLAFPSCSGCGSGVKSIEDVVEVEEEKAEEIEDAIEESTVDDSVKVKTKGEIKDNLEKRKKNLEESEVSEYYVNPQKLLDEFNERLEDSVGDCNKIRTFDEHMVVLGKDEGFVKVINTEGYYDKFVEVRLKLNELLASCK